MSIKCLIIDDEQTARQGLRMLCEEYPELDVVGLSKDGVEAIDDIQSFKPDLLFLDIQMPKVNGFEVLQSLPHPHPHVIFITAHDEYAIKAFEINAVDYLLKPFSDERFDKAVKRAISLFQASERQNLSALVNTRMKGDTEAPDLRHTDKDRLVIKADGKIQVVSKRDIVQVEAFDYYVKIHVLDGFHLIRETLKRMEEQLFDANFMRVHKSHIANKSYIKELAKDARSDHHLLTVNQMKIKVSRSKVNEVKKWIG